MRDQYLTEAMGECSHKLNRKALVGSGNAYKDHLCELCNKVYVVYAKQFYQVEGVGRDFSTWQGFGKLWEWAQEQEWFNQLSWECGNGYGAARYGHLQFHADYINPDRFADAVYTFLKGREV